MSIDKLFNQFSPFYIGLEDTFRQAEHLVGRASYPPHNIIKLDENNYLFELAVAGFAKDEISIEVEGESLVVTGTPVEPEEEVEYCYKGISTRSFAKQLKLGQNIKVKDASMDCGMLTIELERIVPEEAKPKLINIK